MNSTRNLPLLFAVLLVFGVDSSFAEATIQRSPEARALIATAVGMNEAAKAPAVWTHWFEIRSKTRTLPPTVAWSSCTPTTILPDAIATEEPNLSPTPGDGAVRVDSSAQVSPLRR